MIRPIHARRGALLLFLAVAAIPTAAHDGGGTKMRADVGALCSPGMDGRGLGSEGLAKAIRYLEARFAEVALSPYGDDGFRQPFPGPGGAELVNLVGRIPGQGPDAAARHVVVGAHYDHLGLGEPGTPNAGMLHPGADDNASGVAVLLELAQRLSEEPPRHDVIVVAFGGEEVGLLGSRHYVAHPRASLDGCVAMLNLDTVGRLRDGGLSVLGAATGAEWRNIVHGVNYAYGLALEVIDQDPGGSDQKAFQEKGVAAVQFFTGAHADYHRPSDVPEAVDYEGLFTLAGFATETVRYLAERDESIQFVPPGAEAAVAAAAESSGRRRVSFGSIPDFKDEGEGVLLSGVIPGSPADEAGLRAGDRLIVFAGAEIDDLGGYSDVLKGHVPGDVVEVVVLRDGERVSVSATLVERK